MRLQRLNAGDVGDFSPFPFRAYCAFSGGSTSGKQALTAVEEEAGFFPRAAAGRGRAPRGDERLLVPGQRRQHQWEAGSDGVTGSAVEEKAGFLPRAAAGRGRAPRGRAPVSAC
ncbi:hypothetical protein NDU88_001929 [Pleurodeles waltl]|uniref:Uncharacterized protein n=1 Tax=Pleurodeles waltl TaxID=8319 RepID=A0AAV7UU50_PLEWA|nr:hypothetical protein NDU88_001929 [Pleurodeles waltl]